MKKKRKFTTFYIVRHGETVWNVERKMQGHEDSPLTKNGIQQAKLARSKFKDVTFDHVFSSDLLRAQRTAQIIAADRDLAVKTSKLLRESTLGPFEGKKLDFFLKSLQKSIEYRQTLSDEEKMSYKIHPKVESYEETATRMIAFIREVAVAYPGKRILVVSHAGIIKSSLVKLGFATEDELPDGSISNAGYVVVESDGVDFFVKETQGIKKAYS